jgi:predicted MFS family arabinose efflux permease
VIFHGLAYNIETLFVKFISRRLLSGNLGAAFGAWIGGRFFDLTGSYRLTFATAIASGLLAIGCMWAGRRRRCVASLAGGG